MKPRFIFLALGVALLLEECTTPAITSSQDGNGRAIRAAVRDSVMGTVAYRERLALPPGAVLRVQLHDVTQQDVAAIVIGTTTLLTDGKQVPLPFTIRYDSTGIDPTSTYAVQASIEVDGKAVFANDAAYPVITRGNPKQVQMMLRRVQ